MRALTESLRCAACGAGPLDAHLSVAGEMGEEGLIPTTDRFGTALSDIDSCRRCGHMQLSAFPSEAHLAEAYGVAESREYVEEEAGQRATARRLLDRIEAEVPIGRIVDLGSWVGFLLAEARDRGWQPLGVEPSGFASSYAREELGLDVRTGGLLDLDPEPGSADAVVMADVIEHLLDPREALEVVERWLSPHGVLVLALPDAGSRLARGLGRRWWSVIPTHVHYFTRHSMRMLLSRAGYRAVLITTAPKTFSVGYYLSRIGGYSPRLAALAGRGLRAMGLHDRLWTPDFRDRMLVIARPGAGPDNLPS